MKTRARAHRQTTAHAWEEILKNALQDSAEQQNGSGNFGRTKGYGSAFNGRKAPIATSKPQTVARFAAKTWQKSRVRNDYVTTYDIRKYIRSNEKNLRTLK